MAQKMLPTTRVNLHNHMREVSPDETIVPKMLSASLWLSSVQSAHGLMRLRALGSATSNRVEALSARLWVECEVKIVLLVLCRAGTTTV